MPFSRVRSFESLRCFPFRLSRFRYYLSGHILSGHILPGHSLSGHFLSGYSSLFKKMYLVFLIDTSASMHQVTSTGLTFLDYAKSAVERFVPIRGERDCVLLVSCGPSYREAIQVGWENSQSAEAFNTALKNLNAHDLSDIGTALQHVFDLVNAFRIINRVDNYGQGQYPSRVDHAATIVILSDAMQFTTLQGVQEGLTIPPCQLPGAELTREPFRWDQKVYFIQLRLPTRGNKLSAHDKQSVALKALCEDTGGVAFFPTSQRHLLQSVDFILGQMRKRSVTAVVQEMGAPKCEKVQLRKQPTLRISEKDIEYMWPLPEGYWLDRSLGSLPARTAQPHLVYKRNVNLTPEESGAITMAFETLEFPHDTYIVENFVGGPRRGQKWHLFRHGSRGENKMGDPVGFITGKYTNNTLVTVLFLLPYNYPVLFQLLIEVARVIEKLGHAPKAGNPWILQSNVMPSSWRTGFTAYMTACPPCYFISLQKALKRFNLHSLVPVVEEGGCSNSVNSYLKQKRDMNGVLENERMRENEAIKLKETNRNALQEALEKRTTLVSALLKTTIRPWRPSSSFAKLMPTKKAATEDIRHAIPIRCMADYLSFLNVQEAPRDPLSEPEKDEDTSMGLRRRRQKCDFGNPYSKSIKSSSSGDEAADEAALLQKRNTNHTSPRRSRSRSREKRGKSPSSSSPVRKLRKVDSFVSLGTGLTAQSYRVVEKNAAQWGVLCNLVRCNRALTSTELEFITTGLSDLHGGEAVLQAYRKQLRELATVCRRKDVLEELHEHPLHSFLPDESEK